jgi:hypothetical protein
MKSLVRKLADNTVSTSSAVRMRRERFAFFLNLLHQVSKPVHILDIGGTQKFWETMECVDNKDLHITLLNLEAEKTSYRNFSSIVGDATNLTGIARDAFDVVFSNSVIEHVGGLGQQQMMAGEIQRVGRRYFVQTPNYFFPLEPHFLFPGFQWLPISVRVFLLRHFELGWKKRTPDHDEARRIVESIRLLRKRELLSLFPDAEIYEEKLWVFVKSFVVYDGW